MCDFMKTFCAELFLSSEETGGENGKWQTDVLWFL